MKQKYLGFNGNRTHDLGDTGAMIIGSISAEVRIFSPANVATAYVAS